MSKAMVATSVKRLAIDLSDTGFAPDSTFRLKRSRPLMDQFIELQPGHDWLDGRYTCKLCWKITADGIPADDVYDYVVGIGFVSGDQDIWLSHENREASESTYQELLQLLRDHGMPFLNSVFDLKRIVEMYESAVVRGDSPEVPTSPLHFFGKDEGWKKYNLGFAYRALGSQEIANRYLKTVIEHYSADPFDWVKKRKSHCANALAYVQNIETTE